MARNQFLCQDEASRQIEMAIQALVAAGLLTPPPGQSSEIPLSEEERRELAERMGQSPGKPLSEIIIENRGPR
ncbi:MAG: hypothetical protein JXA37_12130 [Chloroflexia bacterium]|nr:hypothetical protein [Chloroflexia bacterium]